MHLVKPGILAFWLLVSMNLFLMRKQVNVLAGMVMKIFPLGDGMGDVLFGIEHTNGLLPLSENLVLLPSLHELLRDIYHPGTVLVQFVGQSFKPRGWMLDDFLHSRCLKGEVLNDKVGEADHGACFWVPSGVDFLLHCGIPVSSPDRQTCLSTARLLVDWSF